MIAHTVVSANAVMASVPSVRQPVSGGHSSWFGMRVPVTRSRCVLMPYGGAGHERGLIGGVVALVYPSEIVGGDGADGLHLVGEGFTEGGDGEFIAFAGLVEFGEHEFVGEASVCGDDGVGSCSPDRQGCSHPVSGADGERLFACSVAYG